MMIFDNTANKSVDYSYSTRIAAAILVSAAAIFPVPNSKSINTVIPFYNAPFYNADLSRYNAVFRRICFLPHF